MQASKVSGFSEASETGQVSQPVQVKRAGAGDLSKPTALFKSKFRCILRFWYHSVLVLNPFILKVWSVILNQPYDIAS